MSSQFNDAEDDTPIYTRRAAVAAGDRRTDEIEPARHPEREVTLNTGIVLALFFALALLCAIFFGFGYSIGHKSAPSPVAVDMDPTPVESTTKVSAKPTPASPAPQPVPEYVPTAGANQATAKAVVTPVAPPASRVAVAPAETTRTAEPVRLPAVGTATAVALPVSAIGPAAAGTSFVQVAAVSHQEDADVLLSALRRRGYAVQTRSEAADKLIHVQIGPFSNRKEADEMRKRLAGDGYNAFIK